jgi:hypothetical protein
VESFLKRNATFSWQKRATIEAPFVALKNRVSF